MSTFDIFISYRRDGGEALACLLAEKLRQKGYKVFYDIDSLRSGKFNEAIYSIIHNCTDVLCILPEHGLDRCENDEDWVRREIAYAIKEKKHIIPILMRNFVFPEKLPEDIDELRNYNGVTANMEFFDAAFEKLLTMLESAKRLSEIDYSRYTHDPLIIDEIQMCLEDLKNDYSYKAMANLAWAYYKANNQFLNSEAYRLSAKAAEKGNAEAQCLLGKLYQEGKGVEKNPVQAFEWLYKAAGSGNPDAFYELAKCFGNNTLSRKYRLYFMENAVNHGLREKDVIEQIALEYSMGTLVSRNIETADYYLALLPDQDRREVTWKIADALDKKKDPTSFDVANRYYGLLAKEGDDDLSRKASFRLSFINKFWRKW